MKRARSARSRRVTGLRGRTVEGRPLAALLLLAMLPSTAPAQFSVRPAVLEFEHSEELTVIVRNESDQPMPFGIYTGDFDQSETGSHRFLQFGEHPGTCVGRLDAFPDRLVLEPGEEAGLRIRLEPGGPPCWSVIFVEHRPRAVERGARAIERVAVQVLSGGTGHRRDASIRDVAVESGSDGTLVRYVLENPGDVPLRPHGRLEVRTLEGDVVTTVRINPFGVLPGRARVRHVPLPADLPTGILLAVPILDFGADHLVGGQILFDHAE